MNDRLNPLTRLRTKFRSTVTPLRAALLLASLVPLGAMFLPDRGSSSASLVLEWGQSLGFLYFVAYGFAAVIASFFGRKWLALFFLVAGAMAYLPLRPTTWQWREGPSPERGAPVHSITVASMNLFKDDRLSVMELLPQLQDRRVDVFCAQECSWQWYHAHKLALSERFPYSANAFHKIRNTSSVRGEAGRDLMVFSRLPIASCSYVDVGDGRYTLFVTIEIGGGAVDVVCLHPNSPRSMSNFAHRNRLFAPLAKVVRKARRPTVVAGDFNTVPWNGRWRAFVESAGLLQSAHGPAPSFPSYFPVVPIDHILYTEELRCVAFGKFYVSGSDHLGVFGRYELSADSASGQMKSVQRR